MQTQNQKIVHDLGFLASLTKAWKQVIIHFCVFMFFMTWLIVLDRFVGLGGEIVGIVTVVWGPLLAYHAISALNGMGSESDKNGVETAKENAQGKS